MHFQRSEIAKIRFTDIEPVGEGRYGTVYRAFDRRMNRVIAVKEIRGDLPPAQRAEAYLRFEEEARITGQFGSCPYIVTVFAREDDQQQRERYLYLEYLPEGNLSAALQQGRLSEREAALVALHVTHAIAVHWACGIVHRDIKPSNVLIVRHKDGTIVGAKLADYGIAQELQLHTRSQVAGVLNPGTPGYMSPEQATSQDALTAASDLYNVGLLLWEMLTGEPRHRQPTKPISPSTIKGAQRLIPVIERALDPDLQRRYCDPADLVCDLEAIVGKPAVPVVELPANGSDNAASQRAHRHWLKLGASSLIVALALFGGAISLKTLSPGLVFPPGTPPQSLPTSTALIATPTPAPPYVVSPTIPETASSTVAASPTPEGSTFPFVAVVMQPQLNLREGPGDSFQVLATYPQGTMVNGLEQQGDWIHVTTLDGKTGWMYSPFLELRLNMPPTEITTASPMLPTPPPEAPQEPLDLAQGEWIAELGGDQRAVVTISGHSISSFVLSNRFPGCETAQYYVEYSPLTIGNNRFSYRQTSSSTTDTWTMIVDGIFESRRSASLHVHITKQVPNNIPCSGTYDADWVLTPKE